MLIKRICNAKKDTSLPRAISNNEHIYSFDVAPKEQHKNKRMSTLIQLILCNLPKQFGHTPRQVRAHALHTWFPQDSHSKICPSVQFLSFILLPQNSIKLRCAKTQIFITVFIKKITFFAFEFGNFWAEIVALFLIIWYNKFNWIKGKSRLKNKRINYL